MRFPLLVAYGTNLFLSLLISTAGMGSFLQLARDIRKKR